LLYTRTNGCRESGAADSRNHLPPRQIVDLKAALNIQTDVRSLKPPELSGELAAESV
jgi:hypothetical protein